MQHDAENDENLTDDDSDLVSNNNVLHHDGNNDENIIDDDNDLISKNESIKTTQTSKKTVSYLKALTDIYS